MVLTTDPHQIYKQGNYVVIKSKGKLVARVISSYTYANYEEGVIRFAWGANGLWMEAHNFLKADGSQWGDTAETAVANYLATNTVMENSSRANMPIPTPVRVVNFPDAGQGGSGGISSNVSVLNFPESQPITGHVTVDNLPQTQVVSGSVSIANLPETQQIEGNVIAQVAFPDVQEVSGTVTAEVEFPAVQTVHVDNMPATQKVEVTNPQTSIGVTGHVSVDNFPETQNVVVEGPVHAVIDNLPGTQTVNGTVNIGNLPTTQPVSGTVGIQGGNTQAVKVDNSGVTQPISGAVSVSNLPAIQQVGGMVGVNNFPASQAITGTVTANIQGGNGTAVKVDGTVNVGNWPSSQNVSLTGPITIANPVSSVSVTNFPAKQAIEGGNASPVSVTGTFWPATQPVSGSVSVSNFPATQPISGTVTVANPVSTVTVANPTTSVSINGTVTTQDSYQILPADTWQYSNASLAALTSVPIATAIVGRRHYITGIQIYNLATLVLGTVEILDGTTVIARVQVPAAGGKELVFPTPLRGSINSAISVRPATASVALMVSAQGYVSSN